MTNRGLFLWHTEALKKALRSTFFLRVHPSFATSQHCLARFQRQMNNKISRDLVSLLVNGFIKPSPFLLSEIKHTFVLLFEPPPTSFSLFLNLMHPFQTSVPIIQPSAFSSIKKWSVALFEAGFWSLKWSLQNSLSLTKQTFRHYDEDVIFFFKCMSYNNRDCLATSWQ